MVPTPEKGEWTCVFLDTGTVFVVTHGELMRYKLSAENLASASEEVN